MASEKPKTTQIIEEEIAELKDAVHKIRHNELAHIETRLSDLESKVRMPLTTLYLILAFIIFIISVAVITLPPPIGWSVAGIGGVIVILTSLAIFRIIKTNRRE